MHRGLELKAGKVLDTDQYDVVAMQAAGATLMDLTAYPLNAATQMLLDGVAKGQMKGMRPEELQAVFAGLSQASTTASSASPGVDGVQLGNSPALPVGSTAGAGVGGAASRDDHVHPVSYAVIAQVAATASAPLLVNGQRVGGAADPTNPQDLATKAYVDAHTGGGSSTAAVIGFGNALIGTTPTARYLTPGFGDAQAPLAAFGFRVPFAGTLRYLRARHSVPRGNGANVTYAVRVNGVTTPMACTLPSTGTDGSDLVNFVAISAGDLIDITVTKAATLTTSPTDVIASLEMAP